MEKVSNNNHVALQTQLPIREATSLEDLFFKVSDCIKIIFSQWTDSRKQWISTSDPGSYISTEMAADISRIVLPLIEKNPEQIPGILSQAMHLKEHMYCAAHGVIEAIAKVGNAEQIAALIKEFPYSLELANSKERVHLDNVMWTITKAVKQEYISQLIAPILASVKTHIYCPGMLPIADNLATTFVKRANASECSNLFNSLLAVLRENRNSDARAMAGHSLANIRKKLSPSEIPLLIDSFINALLEDSAAEVHFVVDPCIPSIVLDITPDQLPKVIDRLITIFQGGPQKTTRFTAWGPRHTIQIFNFKWTKPKYSIKRCAAEALYRIAERTTPDQLFKLIAPFKEAIEDSDENIRWFAQNFLQIIARKIDYDLLD